MPCIPIWGSWHLYVNPSVIGQHASIKPTRDERLQQLLRGEGESAKYTKHDV
jgi:hypothetical protein